MFVVAARYLIKDGNEKAVIDILKKMIPISRAEPACRCLCGEPVPGQSPQAPALRAVPDKSATRRTWPARHSRKTFWARSCRCWKAASATVFETVE
jgi:hypothetical protein